MSEPPAQVTPTGIEVSPRPRGYHPLDLVIAGSAIMISCISLYIAIQQTETMQKTLAASSWPLLQIRTSNAETTGAEVIAFTIQNVGVGPAIVKNFYSEYDGKRTSVPNRIIDNCCGKISVVEGKFEVGNPQSNFVANTVIRAGDDLQFLRLPRAPKNDAIWQRLDKARFKMKYFACYCSILGACWESDLTGIDPKEVRQCAPAEKIKL